MSWEAQSQTEQDLDPWRVILGYLFELDSYKIPGIIDMSGLVVEWTLSKRENHSHKYRNDAFRPRINATYEALSKTDRLRVAYIIVEQLALKNLGEKLNTNLQKIGWRLEGGKLMPANETVHEIFFPQGSQHDAYVRIKEILQSVKSSLRLVDPYLDGTIFTILGNVQVSLKIDLLTGNPPPDFAQEAAKFQQQHQSVKVEIRKSKDFHDRFIVIDEKECWHIGCSIKDAGNKAFMMSFLEDKKNSNALLKTLDDPWANATPQEGTTS